MNPITQDWSRNPSSPHDSFNPVEVFATFDQGSMPPARCVVARIYSWSGYGPENKDRRKREASEMADRVIASVNACADMADPAATIKEMRDLLNAAQSALDVLAMDVADEFPARSNAATRLAMNCRRVLRGQPQADPSSIALVGKSSHPQEAEVRSLLEYLVNAGFRLADVNDGGEDDTPISTLEEARRSLRRNILHQELNRGPENPPEVLHRHSKEGQGVPSGRKAR